MRKKWIIFSLLIFGMSFLGTMSLDAGPLKRREVTKDLTFGGSMRGRGEFKDDFQFDHSRRGNDENFFLSQIRLNLKWTPSDGVTFFIEAQDAEIIGEKAINEDAVPNINADDFDLHQGYVDIKTSIGELPMKTRIGRQKLSFGNQRLVSPLEWVNTARVFDAARVTVGTAQEQTLDLFASHLVPVNPNNFNDWGRTGNRMFDSQFYGAYYTNWKSISNTRFELYWLLRQNDNVNDHVHTLGGRFTSKWGKWDANAEAAGQFGDYGNMNHSAAMAHAGGGYTLFPASKTRLGAAYNYGSGDGNAADNKHNTFDNLFPLNHAYYGYMDFFALQNVNNLEATLKTTLWGKINFRAAYQGFWLVHEDNDSWYNAGGAAFRTATVGTNVDPYVGSEIDLTASTKILNDWMKVVVGYSHFYTGNYVSDLGGKSDADFAFLQTKVSF